MLILIIRFHTSNYQFIKLIYLSLQTNILTLTRKVDYKFLTDKWATSRNEAFRFPTLTFLFIAQVYSFLPLINLIVTNLNINILDYEFINCLDFEVSRFLILIARLILAILIFLIFNDFNYLNYIILVIMDYISCYFLIFHFLN